ncbi:MAG: RNA methyltransferase [Pikeienuella sp.]
MILVEPQMGENIGAAARGMWNFGLRAMRLVAPRDGWPNPSAVAMASGAGALLDDAQVYDTTADAVADLNYIFATTARPREMAKTVLTPVAAAKMAHEMMASGKKVGFLFGRERTGLETSDVVRANAIVTVPVNPRFASLNLAQCVLLMSYELRRVVDETPVEKFHTGKSDIATAGEVDMMVEHLVSELDDASFFFPENKRTSMLANLANLFQRAPLTSQDVRTMRGVIRALSTKRRS